MGCLSFPTKKKKITFLRRAWKAGGQILASDLQDGGVYSSMEYIYIYILLFVPLSHPPSVHPGLGAPASMDRRTDGQTDGLQQV